MALSLCVLSFLFLLDGVHGFSAGPPLGACGSMAPNYNTAASGGHGAQPQTGSSPFTVTHNVSDGKAYTGQSYEIQITSSASNNFKGFMCQVRNYSNNADTKAWGEFVDFPAAKAKNLACTSPKGAVIHMNAAVVTSLNATWTAPSTVVDSCLQLYCTVVQVKATYWVKLVATSDPFGVNSTCTVTEAPTTPVVTTEAPTPGNDTSPVVTPTTPKSGSTSNVACTLLVSMTLLLGMLSI